MHAIDEFRRKEEPKPIEPAAQPIEPKPEYVDEDTHRVSYSMNETIEAERAMRENPTQENIDKVIAIYESSAKEHGMKLVYQSAIDKLKNGEITTFSQEYERIKEYAERNKSGEVLPEAQGAEGKVGGSGDMPEVNKTVS